MRSHLATCQHCRAKHMRHLRIEELSSVAAPAPTRTRFAWPRLVWRWLRPAPPARDAQTGAPVRLGLLGRMPMVPQVASGTVMLLIVLVGLWSLPQLTRRHAAPHFEDRAAGDTLRRVKPNAAGELAANDSAAETSTSAARAHKNAASAPPSAAEDIAPSRDDVATEDMHRGRDLEAGLEHYRAREYARATPLLSRALAGSVTGSEQAMTLLYLARAERALGHCDRAVNSYATLVRVHSAKSEASAALREGVACYDDMSEPGHAQHLLEQAASNRSLGADARTLMAQRSGARKPSAARNKAHDGHESPGHDHENAP